MNKQEAKIVALHFSYLVGEPFYTTGLKIEKLNVFGISEDDWRISISVYLGDKEGWDVGHSELISDLWYYLTNNNIKFNPEDIELSLRKG